MTRTLPSGCPRTETLSNRAAAYKPERNRLRLLDALPAVAAVIENRIPILFDSGMRYGSDAIKALALGARAVLLARLYVWGLAIAGEQGVRDVVQNFLADLDLTMGLSGFRSVRELNASMLTSERT
ncbi:MAG TPA: alpha-hydroxy-acid oxidizing protein [Candidatus Sulfotelmatobacter sp.]